MSARATRRAQKLVGCYPPWFRERYGAELRGVVAEVGGGTRVEADLLVGAARAWLSPAPTGEPAQWRQRRLQASVATTWVAWCVGFLVAPAVNRALLDPPLPTVSTGVRELLSLSEVAFFGGWVVALLAGLPLGWQVLRVARQRGDRHLRRQVTAPVLLLAVELAGLGLLAWLRGPVDSAPSLPFAVVGLVWLAGFAVLVVTGGLAPAAAVTGARLPARALGRAAVLAVVLALALAVEVGATALAVALAGQFDEMLLVGVLAVAAVATLVALVSSGRGAIAVTRPTGAR